MSNRNDDDFNFDDDLFGSDPAPDTDADLNFDDDPLSDVGGLGGDDFSFDDDMDGGRTNRTFVVLAFIIILLFIAGVAAIVLFALNRGPDSFDMTATQISVINTTQEAFLLQTQTQSAENVRATTTAAVIGLTGTAISQQQETLVAGINLQTEVAAATQTALAQPTESPTPSLTPSPDMTLTASSLLTNLPPAAAATAIAQSQTQAALDIQSTQTQVAFEVASTQTQSALEVGGTQTSIAATQNSLSEADRATAIARSTEDQATRDALGAAELATMDAATLAAEQTNAALNPPTATGQITPGGVRPADVALTATALSQILSPQTPGPLVTSSIGGTPVPLIPTRLPETGLFDDIGGGNSFGVLALVALGLVGVIFGARRLRK